MLTFDASKYPPPPSEIATYQVNDPTICRSECRISNLCVFGYLNLLSNLLCGGGATMLYFFRPLLFDYINSDDFAGHLVPRIEDQESNISNKDRRVIGLEIAKIVYHQERMS